MLRMWTAGSSRSVKVARCISVERESVLCTKANICIPHDSAIPLGTDPQKCTQTAKDIHKNVHRNAIFTSKSRPYQCLFTLQLYKLHMET